ncbi:YjbE family putative metal transport protein [Desulfofundulus thermobenzoicus]|uniref:YjbE family putative metal transport protein n=1 Tax=Desulfofundulus thermobenzoicus TaxID=29376 RepID=A0A6N7ILM2_9FIRM|nr:TerC family protein [Desulfofundulus thermobenzoicus]MQL50855.1 YjbE family putative metal transport protein [Desulfofundulus thermobenzoicus]HHW42363.1 TerC family protein [Desulfotomaculum sp.]
MFTFIAAVFSIVIINLVLSGDNALVIAMACRCLPAVDQKKAVFWGTFGAVALRVVLTVAAVYLLKIPFLQLVGGLLLVWIALKLLLEDSGEENVYEAGCFWDAVKTIVMADFVMSLDNVLGVAAAARGNLWLLIFGLALSVPIVVAGSSLIIKILKRLPLTVDVGAAILGWTAGEMILKDRFVHPYLGTGVPGRVFPVALAGAVVLVGHLWARRREEFQ